MNRTDLNWPTISTPSRQQACSKRSKTRPSCQGAMPSTSDPSRLARCTSRPSRSIEMDVQFEDNDLPLPPSCARCRQIIVQDLPDVARHRVRHGGAGIGDWQPGRHYQRAKILTDLIPTTSKISSKICLGCQHDACKKMYHFNTSTLTTMQQHFILRQMGLQ